MALPANKTLLVITGQSGVTLYSSRGLDQNWGFIDQQAAPQHDVDGVIQDMCAAQFAGQIWVETTCADLRLPKVSGLRRGSLITVDCVFELNYLTASNDPDFDKVTDSDRVEGDYTHYRPVIDLMVTDFRAGKNEYGAKANWSMRAVERQGSV
jgi:hypothetical protein